MRVATRHANILKTSSAPMFPIPTYPSPRLPLDLHVRTNYISQRDDVGVLTKKIYKPVFEGRVKLSEHWYPNVTRSGYIYLVDKVCDTPTLGSHTPANYVTIQWRRVYTARPSSVRSSSIHIYRTTVYVCIRAHTIKTLCRCGCKARGFKYS